jgi:hypothetical protein
MNSTNLRLSDLAGLSANDKKFIIQELNLALKFSPELSFWIEGYEVDNGNEHGTLRPWFVGSIHNNDIPKGALWSYYSSDEIMTAMGVKVYE